MTHLSLFTGIGGIDIAAEMAGFETVGQCEFADYPTQVLEKHWPQVPRWRDIHDVTANDFRYGHIKVLPLNGVQWVIIGAETGRRKSKIVPKREWVSDIVNICRAARVPVFLKSNIADIWGEPLIQELPWEA